MMLPILRRSARYLLNMARTILPRRALFPEGAGEGSGWAHLATCLAASVAVQQPDRGEPALHHNTALMNKTKKGSKKNNNASSMATAP